MGFRNGGLIKTPNVDGFVKDGLELNQYYVQSVCSPTRATMMTGRYPLHNTVVDWLKSGQAMALPLNETLIPQVLADAGYKSHMTGKYHLGMTTWQHTPTFRGFDSFVGFYTGGEDYFAHRTGGQFDFRRDMSPNCGSGCSEVAFDDTGRYSAHIFSDEAVRIVNDHDASSPLFLYLAYQSVHSPREVPDSYKNAYADTISDNIRRTFAGMVSAMDEGIGNVTNALRAKGMLDNSVIVFSTDNGGPTPDTPGGDYAGSSNYPLRGGKHSIWEGGTRGTGVFWAGAATGLLPDKRRGTVVQQLMHAADWLPTYASLAGVASRAAQLPLDGVDQSGPLLEGSEAVRTEVFYGQHDDAPNTYPGYDTALRDGEGWKLFQGSGGKPATWSQPVNATLNPLSAAAQCGAKQAGTCYPNNDLDTLSGVSEDECCAACQTNAKCVGYTYRLSKEECFIKDSLGSPKNDDDCSSAPVSAYDGPVLLFNVLDDPEERNEISAQHPEIVARLSARMDELRATKVEVIGGGTHADKSCPAYNKADHVDPQAGQMLEPWCDHETIFA
jgi:arylsulfatase A-like enzyme